MDGRYDRQLLGLPSVTLVASDEANMPNVSRETACEQIAFEGLDVRVEHLDGGYSACFESHSAGADLAELFRRLPDDRCWLPG